MNQLTQTRDSLTSLRKKINDGQIYQSLGSQIGAIMDNLKKNRLTKVFLPGEDEEALDLIRDLRQRYYDGKLTSVTDSDLMMLLGHIGSPDPEVRDRGVYFLVNELLESQIFSKRQLKLAFNFLSSNEVMFDHINEPQNNAIYQRSFAVLLMSTLLYGDSAGYFFMDEEMLDTTIDQMALYITLETDTRGFIKKNGWGHAYTHIGNVLDELARREDMSRADKLFLMTVLIERYKRLESPLIFSEPQRIATYLSHITNKNPLYSDYFLLQLKSWRAELMSQNQPESEAQWDCLMNHTRLMQVILLRGDFNDDILKYIASGQQFLN